MLHYGFGNDTTIILKLFKCRFSSTFSLSYNMQFLFLKEVKNVPATYENLFWLFICNLVQLRITICRKSSNTKLARALGISHLKNMSGNNFKSSDSKDM